MDFDLSDEQEAFRKVVRDFAEREIAPHAEAWDRDHTFPVDVVLRMGELGLFGLPFPEEYGGGGADLTTLCVAIEELARVDHSMAITLEAGVGLGANPIYSFGTEEQKQRWLPDLCAGRALGAFVRALSRLDDTAATADRLDDIKRITAAGSYEVVPWWQLSDFYNKSADLFAKQVGVMKVIIGLLIVLSISNTMTMGVMERTGEIGTAMALGDTRARLLRRFLAEALVLGTLGALLGILAGYGLATIISVIGIPVPAPPGMGHGYTGRILVTPVIAAGAVLLAVATTFVAGVYPAWRASRMVIVDALRRNRA